MRAPQSSRMNRDSYLTLHTWTHNGSKRLLCFQRPPIFGNPFQKSFFSRGDTVSQPSDTVYSSVLSLSTVKAGGRSHALTAASYLQNLEVVARLCVLHSLSQIIGVHSYHHHLISVFKPVRKLKE